MRQQCWSESYEEKQPISIIISHFGHINLYNKKINNYFMHDQHIPILLKW